MSHKIHVTNSAENPEMRYDILGVLFGKITSIVHSTHNASVEKLSTTSLKITVDGYKPFPERSYIYVTVTLIDPSKSLITGDVEEWKLMPTGFHVCSRFDGLDFNQIDKVVDVFQDLLLQSKL